jgi:hypothetical protein
LARELGLWWGVPLVLALVVPYFGWAEAASGGEFLREFLWHHNVERGLGGSPLDHHGHAWCLYGPYFLLYFLPWSPVLLLALPWRGWRADPEARFGLAWALAVLVVLSCARFKRADYLLPACPGAALFVACSLGRWLTGHPGSCRRGPAGPEGPAYQAKPPGRGLAGRLLSAAPPARRRAALAGLLVLALGTVGGWVKRLEWDLPAEEPYRDYTHFAAEVRRRVPRPEPVAFFRTEAHALAFHVGKPVEVLVEWQELRSRLDRPGLHYAVMPPRCLHECRRRLPDLRIEEVLRNTDLAGGKHEHERPLVLLRGRPAGVQR